MKLRALLIVLFVLLFPIFSLTPVVGAAALNMIANPGAELVDSGGSPTDWAKGNWGTNTATFTYQNTGHASAHSLRVDIGTYTNGDAKWYFTPTNVTAGAVYNFSDYYQSSTSTDLVVQFDNGSSFSYLWLKSLPAASAWTQANSSFTVPAGFTHATVFHTLSAVGNLQTDDYSMTAAANLSVNLTVPADNASVSGATVQLAATATASEGVTNVQFLVAGHVVGTPVTTAPYQLNWDSTTVPNGSYNLTAVVQDTAGNTASSPARTIVVNNPVAPGSNMVPNPSLETAEPTNKNLPQNWQTSSWGTNATTFTYINSATTAHTGTRALRVQTTSYTDGDSKWYFTPQTVDTNKLYVFSNYYHGTTASYVVADFTMQDGTDQYVTLGTLQKATNWTKFEQTFSVPTGAKTVTIFHLIQSVGQVVTDDYSLSSYDPIGFDHARISLTFDDSWSSIHDNGLPILKKYGLLSTQYVISGKIGTAGYMTRANLDDFKTAGHEIGSHTVSHLDLTTLSSRKLTTELQQSQKSLQTWTGQPVADFASPYGSVNATVISQIKLYYKSHRGVVSGFNSKNYFNAYDVKVQDITSSTSLAQIQAWINQAKATNTWLVLVYHQIDTNPAAGDYNTDPATFDQQMSLVKNSGVSVETFAQALTEVQAQL